MCKSVDLEVDTPGAIRPFSIRPVNHERMFSKDHKSYILQKVWRGS